MAIKFGPAGLGGIKDAISNLEEYHKLGFKACEIAFTYGIYIKGKEDALEIGKTAEKLGIELSIHAPYWINLNSAEKDKVKKSKERILKCCEIGHFLNAKKVVFHPGYYGKEDKEKTYENIKREIMEIQEEIKKNKWNIKIAPESTGKTNVFGSIDEIAKLVEETGCGFCVDFAHILARYKDYKFKEVVKKFEKQEEIHVHFSGIEYGEKGERKHKKTPEKDLRDLINNMPENKKIVIINESPYLIEDSVLGVKIYNSKNET